MAWLANDYLAEQVRQHSDRFAGFAALPLLDPKAAAELERAMTQLGFKGALVNGHTNGEYLDERKFWGVWERAEQLGVHIYLHSADSVADQMKIYKGYPGLRSAVWNWTVETATHALRIICNGVFDVFPRPTCCSDIWERLFLTRCGVLMMGGKGRHRANRFNTCHPTTSKRMS